MSLQQLFNPAWYLAQNPDVAQAVALGQISAWQHFTQYGQYESRSPLALFDSAFYLQQNPDVAAAVQAGLMTAAQHFAQYGQGETRQVSLSIDLDAYLRANPDVAQAVADGAVSALSHLVTHGIQEARDLGNGIRLDVFSSDPVFQQALKNGDVALALARADAVAPFLPDYVAPQGWAPKSDTPIPLDFVPPAGQGLKLVIPQGVKVPDGVTLPDTFQPGAGGSTGGGGETPSNPLPGQVLFTTTASTIDKNSSDASTALVLDGGFIVVGDDEAAVLRVYSREGGDAVMEWSIKDAATGLLGTRKDLGADEIDIEGSTRIGDTLYFIGSHSNKKSGKDASEREYLFSVGVTGTGADTAFTLKDVTEKGALTAALTTWDASGSHQKGASYYGLAASAADGIVPEGVNGFSIEGLAASADGTSLYLGFRAPQASASSREKALIVSIKADSAFGASPDIEQAIELNLGGRGIRSIEKAADGSGFLILAGPAGSASAEVTHDFRLYRWDGSVGVDGQATGLTALEVRNGNGQTVSLDSLLAQTGGSFETLVEVTSTAAGTAIQLLQDNGDTIWTGQTKVSKDLAAGQQKFAGNWVTIGAAAENIAPSLAGSNIAPGAAQVGRKADLVLQFDEAVKLGTGSITLRNGDGVVETFSAGSSAVKVNYNTITIDPTNDLVAPGQYTLAFDSGAIQDLDGLAWSGADLSFSVAAPVSYSILISEVNSNGGGGDFIELYNYGTSAIDLSGWRWIDTTSNPGSNDYGVFDNGITLAAGGVLVVGVDSTTANSLITDWSLAQEVQVIAVGGKGLGGGDAVVLYDAADNMAAAFNYTKDVFTAPDGTQIAPALFGAGAAPTENRHAGLQAGGINKDSAVWDGVSTENPNYIVAIGTHPGYVDLGTNGKGTPGYVALP